MRKIYFLLLSTLIIQNTLAQDYSDPVADDEVIVEKPTDLIGSYRERRNRYGAIFSVNYEKYAPNDYFSIVLNKNFRTISGEDSIPLVNFELGGKFNFPAGAISVLAGYGEANYGNDANDLYNIKVAITKISANFSLDSLMSEPWLVPYGQMGVHQIDWLEESYDSLNVIVEQGLVTDWTLNYRVGLLLQLNWLENMIDSNTNINARMSSGLQNTFIDIFYQQYGETSSKSKNQLGEIVSDLQSGHFGAGLKLEF